MAGALQKVQSVPIPPSADVGLPNIVHRADQFHAVKIGAVQFRHHGLNLPAMEHSHQDRLNDVVIVMTERDLITSEFLGFAVKISPSHSRAEIAGVFLHVEHGIEDIRLKDLNGDPQLFRVLLDHPPVFRAVARVHGDIPRLEGHREIGRAHV